MKKQICRNILIVSHSFPPLENMAAKRFGFMARYFSEFGWNPWIITTRSTGLLPVNIPESKIFRWLDHPQKSRLIVKKNDRKRSSIFSSVRSATGRILSSRVIPTGEHMRSWYRAASAQKRLIIETIGKVDLVIGSFPPSTSLWIARYYANSLKAPWIADFRDLCALKADYGNKLSTYIDKHAESYLLKSAAAITAVSQNSATMLSAHYVKKARAIYNGWDSSDYVIADAGSSANSSRIEGEYIYYAGRLCLHRMSSVFLLLEALKSFPNIKLVIRSIGPVYLIEQLVEKIKTMDLKKQVEILPDIEYSIVLEESEDALANVLFEDIDTNNHHSRGTLPGKVAELLYPSPPVLAIARGDSEIGDILNNTNKGRLCSTAKEIVEFLSLTIADKQMFRPRVECVQSFSRKKQAQNFCELFDELTAS